MPSVQLASPGDQQGDRRGTNDGHQLANRVFRQQKRLTQRPGNNQHDGHHDQPTDNQRIRRRQTGLLRVNREIRYFRRLLLLQHVNRQMIMAPIDKPGDKIAHDTDDHRHPNPRQHQPTDIAMQNACRSRCARWVGSATWTVNITPAIGRPNFSGDTWATLLKP